MNLKIDFSFLDNVNNSNPLLSQSSKSECDDFGDSDYDMEEDDRLFEKWVDHDIEFDGEVGKGKSVDNQLFSDEMQNMIEGEHSEGGENSDEFQSVHGSDDEVTLKFPKFNPKIENKNPDLNLGLIFSSKKEAKFAIETHCLRRGMMYKFDRNDLKEQDAKKRDVSEDGFTGQSLKNALWAAARATRIEEFKARMEQLKELDEDAYNWLVSTYLRCYEHAIQGVNGAELWPKCELLPPLPPKYEDKPGRPKKMRRRQPDEPPAASNTTRLKKYSKSLKCGKCGVVGHNARTCNKRSGQAEEMPIGTSQPPSTQESNRTQSTSLELFNAQSASSQPATTVPKRKKLPVRKAGSKKWD
ncbi:UNVERIFIED_CONTAM: hypothetical protein Sangu_2589700 [Sesamum angustifolium]|uniref:CCHC-type domain-containing protein n=1 Tax=Sesamum angustifolium TaxID=2727405 RepID=A0AAW2J6W6_9LAMI